MHLVCPKYIAFKGPSDKREKISPGLYTLTPANYIDVFTVRPLLALPNAPCSSLCILDAQHTKF